MVMILLGWSWVLLFSAQMTLLPPLAATSSSVASGVTTLAKPGCRDKCGNLTIPYPFGIGRAGCYHAGFKVACVEGRPYLPRPFTASSKKNRLTAVGCNAPAIMLRQSSRRIASITCISICIAGQCSCVGYCQTDLARNQIINFSVTLDSMFNNSMIADINPCSYVFLVERGRYKFNNSDLEGDNLKIKYKDGFPVVMDWVVGHEACGKAMMNGTSYACRSRNSQCINSSNAPAGYVCDCSDGYTGNPYLEQGCLDIDECKLPDQYPCHGIMRRASCRLPSSIRNHPGRILRSTRSPLSVTSASADDGRRHPPSQVLNPPLSTLRAIGDTHD